jgi:mannose-6-phosphate isomerase-like protein (cupin superfamily)
MRKFETKRLPVAPIKVAKDGSEVRLLLDLPDVGGLAHFELGPRETSTAITHQSVEEIWYFVSGLGEMWRNQAGVEEIVPVDPGICITIPLGTEFQFRSFGYVPLAAIGVTIPPWPAGEAGEKEAVVVNGPWEPTVNELGHLAQASTRQSQAT